MRQAANMARLLMVFALVILFSQILYAQPRVKFCAVGDVFFDRGIRGIIEKRGINYLFDKVKPIISSHDLAFCNLECPISSSETGYPLLKRYSFRAEPESVQGLVYTGFNVVSIANNHTIDWGRQGFLETIRILNENKIHSVGGGENQEQAMEPVLIDKSGLKFAFFGAVTFLLEAIAFLDDKPGPAYAGIEELAARVTKIKNQVDFVIVSFHWGIEDHLWPTSRQVEYAHRIVDAGADLVLGHHPHVLQSIEIYKNRFIIYSLGNFVFDNTQADRTRSAIFTCEFNKGEILSPRIIPIKIQNCIPQPASAKDSKEILKGLEYLSKEYHTKFSIGSGSALLTGDDNSNTTLIPIKEWKVQTNELRVYTCRLELTDPESGSITLPINNKTLYIRDACLIREDQTVYVYAIVGDLHKQRGKQLAVFPIDLEKEEFRAPLLDSHTDFNPWKIRAGDIDGDGNPEILLGVWKKTRHDPVYDNRIFVFNRYRERIYPKWLGSRLGRPFMDFESCDIDGDRNCELIALEIDHAKRRWITIYKWNEFGFDEYRTSEVNSGVDFLSCFSFGK